MSNASTAPQNHIRCARCDCSFCYICGEEAAASSTHWRSPGCPRFNQPNAGAGEPRPRNDSDFDEEDEELAARQNIAELQNDQIYFFPRMETASEPEQVYLEDSRWYTSALLYAAISRQVQQNPELDPEGTTLWHHQVANQAALSAER